MTTRDPRRRPTIMDVARLAGVSHQTVSRFLRDEGKGLKESNRERIDAAMRELDYRPNLVARSMRTRRTGRLAIVLPSLRTLGPARMLIGAVETAHAEGFVVEVVSLGGGARARTERMSELADAGQVEGILSLSPLDLDGAGPMNNAAVVVSADYDDEMRGIGELADASPVVELIERLADQGHRRFLHVTGDLGFASARGRRKTYEDTIAKLGLESFGVIEGTWSAEAGSAAIRALPEDSGVTAIIAGSDVIAAGVCRGAKERGWRVPEDLSVTGWDDNPVGAHLSPSLTTVDVDLVLLGENAMRRLVAAVRDTTPQLTERPLNRIIWRESTGPVPGSVRHAQG
ncbi:LacI family DNA-binding transcriptional regulator [Nocardiopsis sp. MG754419]|uniref:LacI family DNA-binding transcriptional regulator n=1 Tax=Nocardiopsis sp. MG754419 TaxID=2259865 RepID=UPI001BA7194B|nr:LacI family DNA-binding transcriptional regulator [Nocardiopsis sp. MG754419]MBR8745009.1 LacI family transcriptional regulator [Nocardiopsis sp. MG754419]